jgi:cyclopropane fatty-acyl-phospholipid synthase-like methyltransferase
MIQRFLEKTRAILLKSVTVSFKKYEVKKLLELGRGQGRDTIFFASNGLDVHAIDSSKIAIKNINQKIRGKNISAFKAFCD